MHYKFQTIPVSQSVQQENRLIGSNQDQKGEALSHIPKKLSAIATYPRISSVEAARVSASPCRKMESMDVGYEALDVTHVDVSKKI